MKKGFIIFLFFCAFQSFMCLGNKTDSLIRILSVSSIDTDQINILQKISTNFLYTYPDSALPFVNQAISIARKSNNQVALAKAYYMEGNFLRFKTKYPEALRDYLKSKELCEKLGLKKLLCQNLNMIAFVNINQENFNEALISVKKAMESAMIFRDNEEIARSYFIQGLALYAQNKFDMALSDYRQSLRIRLQLNQNDETALIYNEIGRVFLVKANQDSALWYFQTAYNMASTLKHSYHQSVILNNLAWTYHNKGNEKKALFYELETIELAKNRHDSDLLAGAYQNIALFYANLNDYKAAYTADTIYTAINDFVYNNKKAKQIDELQIKYKTKEQESQLAQAKLARAQEEKKSEATRILLIIVVPFTLLVLLLALLLYNRNRTVTRAKKKVETVVNELTVAREKLLESEKELENKVELRTAELAEANTQLVHEIEEKNRAEAEIIEFNKKVAELQMTSLRLQMNPHFIFNSLNSIQHFIYNNDKEEAASYLAKFSRLIRQILEHANENTIVPADDLKMLELYLELEMLRFDNKFEYELDIDPEIDIHNIEIPSMLIQPFVENAILHGLVPKDNGKGKIIIRFLKRGNAIDCVIEDNGVGRDKSTEMKAGKVMNKKSLGIKVSRERLAMLNIDEDNQGSVAITDLKDLKGNPLGTRVEIRIPLEED